MERLAVPKRLRVMQFSYGHALYGAERWVLTLIKNLDQERVETYVCSLVDRDHQELPLLEEARDLGFKTITIDATQSRIWSSARQLATAIQKEQIDIMHSHGARQDFLALLARLRTNCKLLSTPHGWEARSGLKERIHHFINKLALVFFDSVAPLSTSVEDALRWTPIPTKRLQRIPNGVDLQEVDSVEPAAELLPGEDLSGRFVIGCVGRLSHGKGLSVLLHALARLSTRNWLCLLVGEGPERSALECLAAKLQIDSQVCFLGFSADRIALIKRFDLLAMPSYCEGTPRVLMEALAAATPCVGSKIPGIECLIEPGVSGDLFPAGDDQALARLIELHMADRSRAEALGERGSKKVRDEFSGQAMARAYESLYSGLVGREIQ